MTLNAVGPVELAARAASVGEVDEETRARIRSIDADTRVRVRISAALVGLFILLKAAVIWLVWHALQEDIALLKATTIEPEGRLITENVFLTLIGATVVQVGVILVAIAGYLFPRRT